MNDLIYKYKLGIRYLHGIGVQKNTEKALIYINKCSSKGFVPAQISLAFIYFDDDNIICDKSKAYIIFKVIADEEYNSQAELMVAMMNQYGYGKSENIERSLKYYKRSLDQGNIYAKNKLIEYQEDNQNQI